MGKGKGRGDEHACRVNYLFQAGELVAGPAPQLSQYYGTVLTVVTEKTAPQKDFTMKRLMCKKCLSILKVGENATYRLRKNKRKKGTPNMILTCLFCGEIKRIPTQRNYKLNAEVNGKIISNGNGNGTNGNGSCSSTTVSVPIEPPASATSPGDQDPDPDQDRSGEKKKECDCATLTPSPSTTSAETAEMPPPPSLPSSPPQTEKMEVSEVISSPSSDIT